MIPYVSLGNTCCMNIKSVLLFCMFLHALLFVPAKAFSKIGLDINGGALIHKQKIYDYGAVRYTNAMGGAVAAKVTYQSRYFEIGPYAEYGSMQRSAYLLLGGAANVLIPITDFQFYAGVAGGYMNLSDIKSGSSTGVQIGARYPIFSNLHFNTEISFRHVYTKALVFNAFGVMAGFHVKF